MCGDSRHDLNYPEIPDSWNNEEKMKRKLEIFTKTINSDDEFTYHSKTLILYRVKFARTFGRMIEGTLCKPEKPYRLFILYKDTHRVKRMAGRYFMWDETEETCNGIDVESGEQGFGEPRFDGVASAVFITDKVVLAFGDARIVATQMSRGEKYAYCDVYLCGRLVTVFKIPAGEFNRIFAQGLQVK